MKSGETAQSLYNNRGRKLGKKLSYRNIESQEENGSEKQQKFSRAEGH